MPSSNRGPLLGAFQDAVPTRGPALSAFRLAELEHCLQAIGLSDPRLTAELTHVADVARPLWPDERAVLRGCCARGRRRIRPRMRPQARAASRRPSPCSR